MAGIVLVREDLDEGMNFDYPDGETWSIYLLENEDRELGYAVWSPRGKIGTRHRYDDPAWPDPFQTYPMGWSFRCDYDWRGRLVPNCMVPMGVNSRRSLVRAILARLDENVRAVDAYGLRRKVRG